MKTGLMSKRLSVADTDCPTKRKARTLMDYYQLKDKSASLTSSSSTKDDDLLGDADSSGDPDDEPQDQDGDSDIVSQSPDPGQVRQHLALTQAQ